MRQSPPLAAFPLNGQAVMVSDLFSIPPPCEYAGWLPLALPCWWQRKDVCSRAHRKPSPAPGLPRLRSAVATKTRCRLTALGSHRCGNFGERIEGARTCGTAETRYIVQRRDEIIVPCLEMHEHLADAFGAAVQRSYAGCLRNTGGVRGALALNLVHRFHDLDSARHSSRCASLSWHRLC